MSPITSSLLPIACSLILSAGLLACAKAPEFPKASGEYVVEEIEL